MAKAKGRKGKTTKASTTTKKTTGKTVAKPTRGKRVAAKVKTEDDVDYKSMTVAQLKKECEENGLETGGKKADLIKRLQGEEEEAGPVAKVPKLEKQTTLQKAAADIVKGGTGKRKTFKPDKQCTLAKSADCQVYDDFDVMLNKTDIAKNNNKYYLIQLLTSGKNYYSWNRWGRVGDPPGCFHGQKLHGPFKSLEPAQKSFESKFKDKTKTKWADRDNYVPTKGKYNMIEMGEEEDEVVVSIGDNRLEVTASCTLGKETQALVKFIFDTDMFKKAMIQLSFDVRKMPLGKISKIQIAKGFEVLQSIRDAIDKKQTSKLSELSSAFYTVIPHDFGWKRPSVINSRDEVREKMDNLLVLGDIELAQAMQKGIQPGKAKKGNLPPHPLDASYNLLDCDLDLLDENSKDYKILKKYLEVTKGYNIKRIRNIWKMDRKAESGHFKKHDSKGNRRLLWHGTNVAVCAAILKDGLRIMPHSGGRVGKGLYFASENSKSAAYVRSVDKIGVMFLNEVVLGKEHTIVQDDSSLVKPPSGHDSIVARGRTEPDPKNDTSLMLDGKKVVVPQGQPINFNEYNTSSFSQSEYLVYDATQVRMRYFLQLEWNY